MTVVLACVAAHALQVYGFQHRVVHLASSRVSLQGEYAPATEAPRAIRLTHGDSKEHRPDLKQAVVSLICTDQAAIPVWLEVLSGNNAAKPTFPRTVPAYVAQLQAAERPGLMADSALYAPARRKAPLAVPWLTHVPEPLQDVRDLLPHTAPAAMQPAASQGSRHWAGDSG